MTLQRFLFWTGFVIAAEGLWLLDFRLALIFFGLVLIGVSLALKD